MIARVGTFNQLDETPAMRRNLIERFAPALGAQEGFIAGYWLVGENGKHLSVTIWSSREALETGGIAANAVPLLPGMKPEELASPDVVEIFEVSHAVDAASR